MAMARHGTWHMPQRQGPLVPDLGCRYVARAHPRTCLGCGLPLFQVLLQMNIAYYLPSIPVLLLFGQVEKLLDAKFGPTTSMAMRLMAGGCAAREVSLTECRCGRHRGAPKAAASTSPSLTACVLQDCVW